MVENKSQISLRQALLHPNTPLNYTCILPTLKLAIIPGGHGEYIGEITTIKSDFKESDLVVPMIEKFLNK
jgi:hypothetical protein